MRERINREYSRVVFLQKTLAISHKNTYIILRDDEKEKESRDYNNKEEEEE